MPWYGFAVIHRLQGNFAMIEKEYRGSIGLLQESYRGAYPLEAVKRAWPQVKDCGMAAMNKAIDRLMLNHTHLPPLQRLIDEATRAEQEIRTTAAKEREQEATRDKNQHQQAQGNLARPNAQETDIGKRTCQLVRALMIGKITRQEYLDGLLHLDRLYPAAGFAAEANRIRMRYEANGLPLGKVAGSEVFLCIDDAA